MSANRNENTFESDSSQPARAVQLPLTSRVDELLLSTLNGATPLTIADVILRMQELDASLPGNDGLKWFNRLYLMVTQQVDLQPPGGAWKSPLWLTRLDVVFAGFYFDAVRNSLTGNAVPAAWSVLFDARNRSGIDRIQFALAGMNAHINHDLALALAATDSEMGISPMLTSPEHADYESVNELLSALMPATLTMLASDTLGVLAEDTGKIGRLLAFWNIIAARDLAWDFSGHLRSLNGISQILALKAQDAMTGALGHALLAAV